MKANTAEPNLTVVTSQREESYWVGRFAIARRSRAHWLLMLLSIVVVGSV